MVNIGKHLPESQMIAPRKHELPLAKSRVLDRFKFKEKELVWAKVRGHPWWPAIVG